MLGDSVAIDAAAVVVGIVLTTSKTEFITTVNRTDGSAAVAAVAVAKAAWWAKKLEILNIYVFYAMNVSTQRERERVWPDLYLFERSCRQKVVQIIGDFFKMSLFT